MKCTTFSVSAAIVFWLLVCAAGFSLLLRHQSVPGAPVRLNPLVGGEAARHATRLVMFAHPKCPCTRASIEELNRIIARANGRLTAEVWFYTEKSWKSDTRPSLWRTAEAIPGVTVHEDIDGREALRLGASTSGSVLVYDDSGNLRFKGGITAGRGHAGINPGESAVLSLVDGRRPICTESPVFGCPIVSIQQMP